jgi:hypothetical protein
MPRRNPLTHISTRSPIRNSITHSPKKNGASNNKFTYYQQYYSFDLDDFDAEIIVSKNGRNENIDNINKERFSDDDD